MKNININSKHVLPTVVASFIANSTAIEPFLVEQSFNVYDTLLGKFLSWKTPLYNLHSCVHISRLPNMLQRIGKLYIFFGVFDVAKVVWSAMTTMYDHCVSWLENNEYILIHIQARKYQIDQIIALGNMHIVKLTTKMSSFIIEGKGSGEVSYKFVLNSSWNGFKSKDCVMHLKILYWGQK